MAASPVAAHGNRILVLGGDLAVIEPVVTRLEDWGAAPVVLFDVPAAMNALLRARPYLVVLDASFGSDLAGLLSVLQGDRALPTDARRSIPTLLLISPETPSLATVLGPSLGLDALRHVRPVRYDQPLAVESALREALQLAGLSSYAPLAFSPLNPAAPPVVPAPTPVPVPASAPVPAPASHPRNRRVTPLLLGMVLLALLAIPAISLATRPSGGRPSAQLTTPSALATPAPTPPIAASSPGTAATSAAPVGLTPSTGSAPAVPTIATPRIPFCGAVEQWRPLVSEALAEAAAEGRLAGAASALDDDLLLALILRESTGDLRALNTGGADEVGLLQLLPTTFAEQLGRSPTDPTLIQAMQDPRSNLRAGIRYLARAFASQAGDLYWSLVAYRAGIEGANSYRRTGGTPIEIDARIRATLETYARHRPDVRLVFVPSPGAPAPSTIRPVLPAGSC